MSAIQGYTCVVRIVHHWVAVHCDGKKKVCISDASEDIGTARVAALFFSYKNKVTFCLPPQDLTKPLLTLIKYGEEWFPAEIHSDRIALITRYMTYKLGGDRTTAEENAFVISKVQHLDFLPDLGITLPSS